MTPFQGYIFDYDALECVTETMDDIPTLFEKYSDSKTICKIIFNINIKYISTNPSILDNFYENCALLAENLIATARDLGDRWRVIYFMYQKEYIIPSVNDIVQIASNAYFNESLWAICDLLAKNNYLKKEKLINVLKNNGIINKIRGDPCYKDYKLIYINASNNILTEEVINSIMFIERAKYPNVCMQRNKINTIKYDIKHDKPSVFYW